MTWNANRRRLVALCAIAASARAHAVPGVEELSRMSLEELARVEVTSVSKAAQTLRSAPASIYVISREEIVRSGAQSIPEALRLAPNLQVSRLTSSGYSITARGFGDNREAQTQANKLLILLDGRTVYSPLFSGVFYDAIDVVMDDLDRIEVISGPGATLWGANAMNGVINIITKSSSASSGLLATAGYGTQETAGTLRFGSTLGAASYRVYAKAFERGSLELADGGNAGDSWHKAQGGFRTDWSAAAHTVTLQGDGYEAKQNFAGLDDITLSGANALGRWEYQAEASHWRVQAYYDRVEREAPPSGAAFDQDTFDIELENTLQLGAHRIVWGAGKRFHSYDIANENALKFLPAHRSLELTNIFAQDTIELAATLDLSLGLKFEDNPFSDWTALPDIRLAWQPADAMTFWVAASRAVRSPTPFDVDVAEFVGPVLFLEGDPNFRNEEVQSYEIGYRGQPLELLTVSISAFYADHEQLRSVEFGSPTPIPLRWGNEIEGNTYGIEAWASIQVMPWWRLGPSVRTLHKRLRFAPESSGLLGVEQTGDDPRTQAALKSSMDFGGRMTLDAFLRYVGELPSPALADYYELSARLAWQITPAVEVALAGFNLLHETHLEYPAPNGEAIERSVYAEVRLRTQ